MATEFKNPKASETVKTEVVCPNDTNPMGILMGGRLVEWMDIAAAVCAQTHAEKICVTAFINEVVFKDAAKIGDVIHLNAKMTRAFTTSMEIKVTATARNILTGSTYDISEAFFTFVALNDRGKPTTVIALHPETDEELNDYESAQIRKNNR